MPIASKNPITHAFGEYMRRDPAFVVNRFRWGGLGVTFNMDEDGLAGSLAAMGTNMGRVWAIFAYLDEKHNSDADDVAVRDVDQIRKSPTTIAALKNDKTLLNLLILIMTEGWTSAEEKKTIAYLQTL